MARCPHIEEFGKLRYVHMIINIYSGLLMATAQTGETTKHVITYLILYMGTPKIIKIDNGFTYVVKLFSNFVPNGILNIRQVFLISQMVKHSLFDMNDSVLRIIRIFLKRF